MTQKLKELEVLLQQCNEEELRKITDYLQSLKDEHNQ